MANWKMGDDRREVASYSGPWALAIQCRASRCRSRRGALFDSWDAAVSGYTRVYCSVPAGEQQARLRRPRLFRVRSEAVRRCAPAVGRARCRCICIVDRDGELARVFGAQGTLAIVVDPAGRLAALLPSPVSGRSRRCRRSVRQGHGAVWFRPPAPVILPPSCPRGRSVRPSHRLLVGPRQGCKHRWI